MGGIWSILEIRHQVFILFSIFYLTLLWTKLREEKNQGVTWRSSTELGEVGLDLKAVRSRIYVLSALTCRSPQLAERVLCCQSRRATEWGQAGWGPGAGRPYERVCCSVRSPSQSPQQQSYCGSTESQRAHSLIFPLFMAFCHCTLL